MLDADNKAVVCDPAKLVLAKAPGSCTHAYHSASAWKGKEVSLLGRDDETYQDNAPNRSARPPALLTSLSAARGSTNGHQ